MCVSLNIQTSGYFDQDVYFLEIRSVKEIWHSLPLKYALSEVFYTIQKPEISSRFFSYMKHYSKY